MFIFLLIAAELAVLYTVFWYLYVRDPHHKKNIRGNLWGTYDAPENSDINPFAYPRDDYGLAYLKACEQELDCITPLYSTDEMILDRETNRYVTVHRFETRSSVMQFLSKLDRALSHLNVRP
jgi:hypothetical protein